MLLLILGLNDACTDRRECRLATFSQRAECSASGFCECKDGFNADFITNTCNSGKTNY
jgi:hypothetical protein